MWIGEPDLRREVDDIDSRVLQLAALVRSLQPMPQLPPGHDFCPQPKKPEDNDLLGDTPLINFKALNPHFDVDSFISLKDTAAARTPEHVGPPVSTAFHEGAVSVAVGNWNAAATMFRLAIDLATKSLLPPEDVEGLNNKTRRDLGLRLPWLFDHDLLSNDLRDLSSCVHQDGNDGAHAGTLTKEDAQDLLDFATALLERVITEPTRLRLAKERREKRREPKAK
jgi:Domain of unknown function (DUF4145)